MFVCLLPCSFYLVPFEHNKISMEEYKHEDFPDDIQEPLLQKMEVEDAITPPMPKNGTADGPKDITLEDVMEEIRSLKLLVVEVKNKQETQEKIGSKRKADDEVEIIGHKVAVVDEYEQVFTGHERFLKDLAQIGSKRKADDEVEIIGHKVAGVDEYEQVFNDGSSSVLGEVDSIKNLAVGATVSKRPITSLVSSPFVPGIWLKPESANNTKKSATQSSLITKSDYKRHPHFKQTTPTLVVEGMTKKKLTFPPSPKATPGQYSKSNLRGNQSMKKEKEVAKSIEGTKKKCKNSGEVTPTPKDRDTKTLSPHRAMIAKRDAQVVSFLFQKSLDTKLRNEVLVWSMGYEGSRGELQCLIPNRPITDLVITLAAARITDRQTETWRQAVWCLPPSFVVDMESGMTLPDIREKYCKKWMTPYTNLQFIYIPMKCVQDHWLLMIVDVAAGISYRLDTFCPLGCTEPRHIRMKKLGLLLYHLLNDAHYSIAFRNKRIILDSSCWAFSTVASIEGIHQITTGELVSLSVQELVDCVRGNSSGCSGGYLEDAFKFIAKKGGIASEANYPYKETDETCKVKKEAKPVTEIKGYEKVPANSENDLLKAVANQPVSVYVDAGSSGFQFYSGGIFTGKCGTDTDHVVTVVGYGVSHDYTEYWLVKNSWGTGWGEKGYMKLKRNTHSKKGLCGIATNPSYPVA